MTNNVVMFPGVYRPELELEVPTEQVLSAAMEIPFDSVVVIGRLIDGSMYYASSDPDMDKVAGMLMRGVQFITSHEIEHDGVAEEPFGA